MIRVNKVPPLKLRRSTAFSRFLARPIVRFGIAGFTSLIITLLLFIFMMYITQNFTKGSSMASQMLFDLNMTNIQDKEPPGRIRVPRPAEIADEPAKPEFSATPEDNPPANSTEE